MIDVANFQRADQIVGEDHEETSRLRAQFDDALDYIDAFSWSEPVEQAYLAFGVGGIFALFLFVFERPVKGIDETLWVVTGDLPSAYFITDEAPAVEDAIDTYCELMEDWADAVERNDMDIKVFPVMAERTLANAEALRRRIVFLRQNFL